MRFSSKTGLKLDKREADTLSKAEDILKEAGRISAKDIVIKAANHVGDARYVLGLFPLSPSGDTSDPLAQPPGKK